MPTVLNTNVASLWASKNLLGAQTRLATSVERLASGLRINRARDDAAGMGVAASLTAQINGANQGIRNLNDAVSSMQTGEGALAAAQEMGQRMLMLATQGANSTLGQNERTSLVDELKKLTLAIDAIGGRTSFAGNPLLGYGIKSANLAVYYSMQISNTPSDRIALDSTAFQNVGGLVGVARINAATGNTAVTTAAATAIATATTLRVASTEGMNVGDTVSGTGIDTATTITAISGDTLTLSKGLTGTVVATTGVITTTRHVIELSTPLPDNIVGDSIFSVDANGNMTALNSQVLKATATTNGRAGLAYAVTNTPTITANSIVAFGDGKAVALGASLTAAGLTADPAADPTVITAAWQTVQTRAAQYVKDVTAQRGLMGAYQNQMDYTLSNLTELSSNLASARSRVIDTDYASETAALTRGQILQQAATAMLAQANQMPNIILTLLK